MDFTGSDEGWGDGAMAAFAVGGAGGGCGVAPDCWGVVMGVSAEIGGMTEGAGAGTVGGSAMAIGPSNPHPGCWRVAQITVAGGAVAMDGGNDVAAMAAGAGRAAGYPAMILDQMVFIVVGVGTMASGAGCSNTRVDGSPYFRVGVYVVMASGASPWRNIAWAVMQGDDLVRGGQCAMAVVALGAAQTDQVVILRLVAHRMTGDAGDSHGRRRAGEALPFLNGIPDKLRNEAFVVAMAHNTVVLMDGIDITHGGGDMTGGDAASGDGDHIMLHRGRWDRMVEGVFNPMAVGAILELTGDAIGNGINDLLSGAVVAFDAGVICGAEGHDMNNAGGVKIRAVMAG